MAICCDSHEMLAIIWFWGQCIHKSLLQITSDIQFPDAKRGNTKVRDEIVTKIIKFTLYVTNSVSKLCVYIPLSLSLVLLFVFSCWAWPLLVECVGHCNHWIHPETVLHIKTEKKRSAFRVMASSNGNIFRVTGPLCGEFTGQRWIPRAKVSDAELGCFLWSAPE